MAINQTEIITSILEKSDEWKIVLGKNVDMTWLVATIIVLIIIVVIYWIGKRQTYTAKEDISGL